MENIKKVIKAIEDYQNAVGEMKQEEFDDFYNICVKNGIINAMLYKLKDDLSNLK